MVVPAPIPGGISPGLTVDVGKASVVAQLDRLFHIGTESGSREGILQAGDLEAAQILQHSEAPAEEALCLPDLHLGILAVAVVAHSLPALQQATLCLRYLKRRAGDIATAARLAAVGRFGQHQAKAKTVAGPSRGFVLQSLHERALALDRLASQGRVRPTLQRHGYHARREVRRRLLRTSARKLHAWRGRAARAGLQASDETPFCHTLRGPGHETRIEGLLRDLVI
mmetsp:Transcript_18603/g.43474  ORF Transcript_18603/g.43474 Transcript_18603/m.43474 type:complete len:226 (-) Transcript_18603:277-954(-)